MKWYYLRRDEDELAVLHLARHLTDGLERDFARDLSMNKNEHAQRRREEQCRGGSKRRREWRDRSETAQALRSKRGGVSATLDWSIHIRAASTAQRDMGGRATARRCDARPDGRRLPRAPRGRRPAGRLATTDDHDGGRVGACLEWPASVFRGGRRRRGGHRRRRRRRRRRHLITWSMKMSNSSITRNGHSIT